VASVKPRKTKLNPDQYPLLTQHSDWTVPTELPDLSRVEFIAVDTETRDNGLNSGRGPGWAYGPDGFVAGVSAAWREGGELKSIYLPIKHPDTSCIDKGQVARWLEHIYSRQQGRTIFCKSDYDIGWTNADLKLAPPLNIDDIGCQAMMLDENRYPEKGFETAYGLDAIADWCGVEGKDERGLREAAWDFGFAGKDVKKNIWRIPARYVAPYAEQDACATLLSYEVMQPKMEADGLLDAYETEMALVPMVHAMRKRGIRLNVDRAEKLRDRLRDRGNAVFKVISDRLGTRVGMDEIRSNAWLVRACESQGVSLHMNEDKASFGKEWMRADPHWLPRAIAEAKQCHEAADKFVQGFLLDQMQVSANNKGARIHASINQFRTEDGGTKSHRFSYSGPPLQQMPSRPDPVEGWTLTEEIAKEIRMSFEPEEGDLWFAPDYSQQEYRLIVHYASLLDCSKADEAVAKYVNDPNTDFHNLVVEMTGLTRRRAKDVNFAKAYGAGVPKFALMTGMELEEAAQTMGQYDGEMPFVKQLNEKCDKQAQKVGYIRMLDGARSHFDDWEPAYMSNSERQAGWASAKLMAPCRIEEARRRIADEDHPWHGKRLRRSDTRKAMNRLIQGGAARQMKKAMRACWQEGFVPMIQMHDELGFSLLKEKDGKRIGEIMREVVKLRVPMKVDEEYGTTWGTAKYSFADARKPGKGLALAA
jgi:DNA polymerase I-like protein with 3'-5' exonuclease and polymerase domains